MALDMFMKIKMKGGTILKGESEDKVHKGDIDILAWSWGASQSATTHMGKGGGGGKVLVENLNVTKYIDSATHMLWQRTFDGEHLEEVTLIVRKAGGEALEYFKIVMTDAIISNVSTGGSGGEDRLTENVTFNFAEVKITYVPQSSTGGKEADKVAGWNIAANAPNT
jgi:type VI secretion system secreted protein Hcp